jgi:hypothetical protein
MWDFRVAEPVKYCSVAIKAGDRNAAAGVNSLPFAPVLPQIVAVGIKRAQVQLRQAIDKTSAHLLLYGTKACPALAQLGQDPSQEAGTRGLGHSMDLGRYDSYKKKDFIRLLR